jgi:hypothetical protein
MIHPNCLAFRRAGAAVLLWQLLVSHGHRTANAQHQGLLNEPDDKPWRSVCTVIDLSSPVDSIA